jgi:serine/threonine-protein kinase
MLDLIAAKALAKDPAARYPDARELAADLRACRAQVAARTVAADADDTIILAPAQADASRTEASQTLRIDPPPVAPPPRTAPPRPEGGLRLRISRRFDSLAATRRLAAMTGASPAVDAFAKTMKLDLTGMAEAGAKPGPAPRVEPAASPGRAGTRARERWILAASVTIAALVALALALG